CVGAMASHRAGIRQIVAGIRVADPRSRYRLWLERKLTRRVSNYICVSQAVAAYSARVGKLPAEKLAVISNGVDIDRFQRARPIDLRELRVSQDRKVLTYVGRLDQQKRVERLVRMFTDIADAIPEYDLILVGDGPQRSELVSQAGRSRFADRIHFVGFRNDVPEILAASDMLLLASQWEGMPNVLLEAMAAGVPLVTFNVEGTEELLDGIAATQFVEANDDEAEAIRRFGDRVVQFARDQNLANRIAQSNIEIAKQFSIPQMVSRYEQLYARLID
ncbi:MAG: glycosyltransferase, partial [Pirellulales bacterium]